MKSNPADLEQLLGALDQILLRMRCGHTFRQALEGMPVIRTDATLCREWRDLRDCLLRGEASLESLQAFREQLQLREKLQRQLRQKTMLPQLQAYLIAGLSLLLVVAAQVIFPKELRPGSFMLLSSVTLIALGSYDMHRRLQIFQRHLWFGAWLALLTRAGSQLLSGHSWITILDREQKTTLTRNVNWPCSFLHFFKKVISENRHFESPCPATWRQELQKASSWEERQALEHLRVLSDLHVKGQPLSSLLKICVEQSYARFESRLQIQAERLSLTLLAPLFLCFLPAFVLTLFGPLLLGVLSSAQTPPLSP